MNKKYRLLSLLLLLYGCKVAQPPVTPHPIHNPVFVSSKVTGDALEINFENKLKTPIRFHASIQDPDLNAQLKNLQPLTLAAKQDTILYIPIKGKQGQKPVFKVYFGDLTKEITHSPVALPVQRKKSIRILQGHNGSYSHFHDKSRYAIDFALKIGDTVYSASNGYVVQMVQGNKYGGNHPRWTEFANKIVVYDPESGRFFTYAHLAHLGSFVETGDSVRQGQPIGLSGNTGYSDTPHLHFNVSIPDTSATGLRSVPVDFLGGFKGKDFRKNAILPKE